MSRRGLPDPTSWNARTKKRKFVWRAIRTGTQPWQLLDLSTVDRFQHLDLIFFSAREYCLSRVNRTENRKVGKKSKLRDKKPGHSRKKNSQGGLTVMNRDFEFRQLLRAYRAGIITEETFECEMGTLENGSAQTNRAGGGFRAMGKTYANEREAVAAMLDRFRAGEANGNVAFDNWSNVVTTDCLRSGIRMIAEREGYHARIFERRMKDLGIECKAGVSAEGQRITEYLSDPKLSDNEKLLRLNALNPDPDAFFVPVCELVENLKDDQETKELFKLYVQDELSSAKWLNYACEALNGPVAQPAQKQSAASVI